MRAWQAGDGIDWWKGGEVPPGAVFAGIRTAGSWWLAEQEQLSWQCGEVNEFFAACDPPEAVGDQMESALDGVDSRVMKVAGQEVFLRILGGDNHELAVVSAQEMFQRFALLDVAVIRTRLGEDSEGVRAVDRAVNVIGQRKAESKPESSLRGLIDAPHRCLKLAQY